MTLIQVDLNNRAHDGQVFGALRRLPDATVGQEVTLVDPGESTRFKARVVEIDPEQKRIYFEVIWSPSSLYTMYASGAQVAVSNARRALATQVLGTPSAATPAMA